MKLQEKLENTTLFRAGYVSDIKQAEQTLMESAIQGAENKTLKFKSKKAADEVIEGLTKQGLTNHKVTDVEYVVYWMNDN